MVEQKGPPTGQVLVDLGNKHGEGKEVELGVAEREPKVDLWEACLLALERTKKAVQPWLWDVNGHDCALGEVYEEPGGVGERVEDGA